jgi:hypothetical protein
MAKSNPSGEKNQIIRSDFVVIIDELSMLHQFWIPIPYREYKMHSRGWKDRPGSLRMTFKQDFFR